MTKATVKTGMSRFSSRLSRDNSKVKEERAIRIGSSLEAAQKMLIYGLEEEVRTLEDKLDEMTDVSTDNVSTTLNVISKSFDSKEFVSTMQLRKVQLALKRQELRIAQETYNEEFSIQG